MPEETAIDVERLLRERGWLRALARGLVGPGEVDDVVQESWLAALGSASPPRASLRAWWAGLARNAARGIRGARRRASETKAEPAVDGDAGELLARAELQERLIAAVRALREPYRTTVLLRYFEGLSLEDLAARAGVPGSTARTRLARALAELRTRVGGESDRSAWAALGALARDGGRSPATVMEVTAMATAAKASVGVVAVAAIAAAAWWRTSGDDARGVGRAASPPSAIAGLGGDDDVASTSETLVPGAAATEDEPRRSASDAPGPVASEAPAATRDVAKTPLELRLDAIADTFLTEEPDVAGLLAVTADLAYAARLVPDSLTVHESGAVSGKLEIGSSLKGTFTLKDNSCSVELDSGKVPGSLRRWFKLELEPSAPAERRALVSVNSLPVRDPASNSLGGTELVGWRLSLDPDGGPTVHRTTTRVDHPTPTYDSYLYEISDAHGVEPRLMPWLAGTDAFDAWLERLRALRGR